MTSHNDEHVSPFRTLSKDVKHFLKFTLNISVRCVHLRSHSCIFDEALYNTFLNVILEWFVELWFFVGGFVAMFKHMNNTTGLFDWL